MNILFIEDESIKKDTILRFFKTLDKAISIDTAESINRGIRYLYEKSYEFVFLDMSLPLFDHDSITDENNEFLPFGGVEILDEVKRKKIDTKVIVITAYDVIEDGDHKQSLGQLDQTLRMDYSSIYVDSIFYNQTSEAWKESIINIIT